MNLTLLQEAVKAIHDCEATASQIAFVYVQIQASMKLVIDAAQSVGIRRPEAFVQNLADAAATVADGKPDESGVHCTGHVDYDPDAGIFLEAPVIPANIMDAELAHADEQAEIDEANEANEQARQERYEAVLSESLEAFRTKVTEAAEQAISTVYSDAMPHIASDTEANIGWRVQSAINNILAGKFEPCPSALHEMFKVSDGYGCEHYISLGKYSQIIAPIWEVYKEHIQNERIEQLEREVKQCKDILNERWKM